MAFLQEKLNTKTYLLKHLITISSYEVNVMQFIILQSAQELSIVIGSTNHPLEVGRDSEPKISKYLSTSIRNLLLAPSSAFHPQRQ